MNNIHSLYIHIPFCDHLCDYCDFPKLQYFRIFAQKYIKELGKELKTYHISRPLKTIYIGGGTPTSLEDDLFLELLKMLDKYTSNIEEYTIECNPESLSTNKLMMMKSHGVNRLSIGIESTHNDILKAINRHHTYEDVKAAIKNAKEVGFKNINVDLILGLPHVSKKMLEEDLDNIFNLQVPHISCYSLTVHPQTVFGIKGINELPDDETRELYDLVEKKMQENGYIHYEVSNYAKPNMMSIHNFSYWQDEEYYGVGLGASGYMSGVRYTNTRSINKYLEGKYRQEEETISLDDDKTYFIMLTLRTIKGLDLKLYKEKFKEDLYTKKQTEIEAFIKEKYLILDHDILIPTYEGMMILDTIIRDLI